MAKHWNTRRTNPNDGVSPLDDANQNGTGYCVIVETFSGRLAMVRAPCLMPFGAKPITPAIGNGPRADRIIDGVRAERELREERRGRG